MSPSFKKIRLNTQFFEDQGIPNLNFYLLKHDNFLCNGLFPVKCELMLFCYNVINIITTGRSVGFCMLCELQKHIVRSFGHHQGEAIKPMAIIQKLKCKFMCYEYYPVKGD